MATFFRRKLFLIISVVVVLGVLGFVFFGKEKSAPKTVVVARGTVTEEVSVTGTVKPAQEINLSFERTGRITRVNASVGDEVTAGTVLVELDRTELFAQLAEADAQVKAQQAKLDDLKNGTRPEELGIKHAELKKAIQDLANDYAGVPDVVNDAYAKADDAIRSKTSQLFVNEESDAPRLSFLVDSPAVEQNAQMSRAAARDEMKAWQLELPRISGSESSALVDELLASAETHLAVVRDSLARTLDAVNHAIGVSATTLDTYRTNIYAARTNVITGLTSINTEKQTIAAQKLVVQRVQNELNLALAGATADQITAQEAVVEQAKANAAAIRAQITKTRLVTSIDGVVTKQDARVGEIASPGVVVARVISRRAFQIETNVPEADVAKVSVEDAARVTLDAYGYGVVFEARVVRIDPAETVVEGVSTYRTTLEFVTEDERIKSGMTANIDILTEERTGVLVLPQWAVATENGSRTVRVQRGDTVESVPVSVGLRGSDGMIEITSGVSEGDVVVTSTEKD